MEHFAFPGNIDFATDEQGTFSCIIHERLLCLFIVYETNVYNRWIAINFPCKWHTSTTSGSKSSPRKIFHGNSPGVRTLTSNSAWTTKDLRHQQETTEQREHRLAQRRQRRQQETEEQRNRRLEYQRHYDHFTLWKTQIYYFAGFPRLYRSKSAKF